MAVRTPVALGASGKSTAGATSSGISLFSGTFHQANYTPFVTRAANTSKSSAMAPSPQTL